MGLTAPDDSMGQEAAHWAAVETQNQPLCTEQVVDSKAHDRNRKTGQMRSESGNERLDAHDGSGEAGGANFCYEASAAECWY